MHNTIESQNQMYVESWNSAWAIGFPYPCVAAHLLGQIQTFNWLGDSLNLRNMSIPHGCEDYVKQWGRKI